MSRYFVGVAHPAIKPGMRNPTSGLSHNELCNLMYLFPRIPLTYEHRGIVNAGELMADDDNLHPQLLHRTFEKLGELHAVKSPVGKVLQATMSPNGALYALFEIYQKFESSITTLILKGHINNLSFSKQETVYSDGSKQIQPIELTVCAGPPRLEHCHIIMAANEIYPLSSYMRKVHDGLVIDVALNLATRYAQLPVVMSAQQAEKAAEDAVTVETAQEEAIPKTADSETKSDYVRAIDSIGDPSVKAKIIELVASLHKGHLKKNDELTSKVKELETSVKNAGVNSALLQDYLDDLRAHLGPQQSERLGIANDRVTDMINSTNPERVKMGAAKIIAAYSFSMNRPITVSSPATTVKRARTNDMDNVRSSREHNPVPMDIINSATAVASSVSNADTDFFSGGLATLCEWKEEQ